MKIEEIALTNLRSYRGTQNFIGLSDVNSFIGPNGAGKSNVFEALKFTKGLLSGNLTRSFMEMVFDRNRDSHIEISFQFSLLDAERDKILKSLSKHNTKVNLEHIKNTLFLKRVNYSFTIGENRLKAEKLTTPNIKTDEYIILQKTFVDSTGNITEERIDLDAVFQELNTVENMDRKPQKRDIGPSSIRILDYSGLSPSTTILWTTLRQFILSWEWFDPTRNVTGRMDSGEELQLSSTGNNLTKFMNSILSSSPRSFVSLADEVIKILPNIQEILAPLKERQATLILREKGLETPTEVNNASYGYMQILILVVGIITKKPNSVLMIEEPELNLHASAQRGLFGLIKKLAKDKQFFLTTHSTIFTGCDDTTSTYLVTKPDGTTRITKIAESKDLKIARDALGHRNIDLFGDECAVFIEGDSEEIAFPFIAQSLGCDFCRKGIRLVNVKSSGKFKKIGEYLRYLKDSEVISYVIADGNKQVKEHLEDWQKEGTIKENNWTVWELEFEDCFSYSMIAQAINEVIKEQGGKLEITAKQLEEEKREGISVIHTLKKLLFNADIEFDKPALAEKLALLLSKEIGKEGHSQTLPEKEIKKIVELVDKKYQKTG